MVFVNHANPEENELALWLSLKLANEGHAVWCDLTKLLGGEKFWEDIQDAIRTRAAKFVYILSRALIVKPSIGPAQPQWDVGILRSTLEAWERERTRGAEPRAPIVQSGLIRLGPDLRLERFYC